MKKVSKKDSLNKDIEITVEDLVNEGQPPVSSNISASSQTTSGTVSVPVPVSSISPSYGAVVSTPQNRSVLPRAIPSSQQSYFYPSSDRYNNANTPTQVVSGFLEIMNEGHGFLRPKFIPSDGDIYISASQIRKFQLRSGDDVGGQARPPKDNERYFGLLKVEKVNGKPAEESGKRPKFEDLTPIYPDLV